MAQGGARNRSGPQPDPNSLKSARIGYTLTALPAEGYREEIPPYPLPPLIVTSECSEDGRRWRERDNDATDLRRERELELWAWAWRTPQACAWSKQPWRWQTVAMWVRTSALCESEGATAADKNSLHRFADQIGLTPAGLKENGWKIAADEVTQKRAEKAAPATPSGPSTRDRFRVVGDSAVG